MPRIAHLPPHLANQIAAGEVIERPSSVVKELVENSLDAGATQIEITLQKAGRERISVSDNGSGMSPEDALLCLERHATSKIRSFDDLLNVSSMGFRGEALPSIASISYLTLTTRTPADATAFSVRVEGGNRTSEGPAAGPTGTTFTVEHLFYNVPARRKFLKSDTTELSHCVELVKAMCLAHPHVGFKLLDGKRSLIDVPAGQTLAARISSLFGADFADTLLPLNVTEGSTSLTGFISPIGQVQPTRQRILFFVNRRPVDGKIFQQALREAYGAHMSLGRYPAAFVFLQLPSAEIDVNVHPAKREIRFRAEREKLAFLSQSLSRTLQQTPATSSLPSADFPSALSHTPNSLPHFPSALSSFSPSSPSSFTPPGAPTSFPLPSFSQTKFSVAENSASRHHWQFLSFLPDDIALFSTPEGMAIVSLGNAQERIAYEKIDSSLSAASQNLLIPALLQLEGSLADTLTQHADFLGRQGWNAQPFGRGTWRLEGAPAWLTPENGFTGAPEILFTAELNALAEMSGADESLKHQRLAQLAAGYSRAKLSHAPAALRLIDELLSCKNPLKTPGGAPTLWHITADELEKRFGR